MPNQEALGHLLSVQLQLVPQRQLLSVQLRPSGQREEVLERQRSVLIPVGHLGVEVGSERLQSQPSGPASQPLGRSQQLVALGRLRRLVLAPPPEPALEHRQLVALVQAREELSGLQLQVQAGPSVEAVGWLASRSRLLQLLVPPLLMPSAGGHSDSRRLPRPSGQRGDVLGEEVFLVPVHSHSCRVADGTRKDAAMVHTPASGMAARGTVMAR